MLTVAGGIIIAVVVLFVGAMLLGAIGQALEEREQDRANRPPLTGRQKLERIGWLIAAILFTWYASTH